LSADKYSADEFESDDSKEPIMDEEEKEEVIPLKHEEAAVVDLDRYVLSLGQGEELTD